MARKIVAVLVLIGLTFGIVGSGYASGTELSTYQDYNVEKRFSYIRRVAVNFRIDGNTAYIEGKMAANSSAHKCELSIFLLKNENGKWKQIGSWSGTGKGIVGANVTGNKSGLAKGTYKVRFSGKLYNDSGVVLETVSDYTDEKVVS